MGFKALFCGAAVCGGPKSSNSSSSSSWTNGGRSRSGVGSAVAIAAKGISHGDTGTASGGPVEDSVSPETLEALLEPGPEPEPEPEPGCAGISVKTIRSATLM